MAADRPPGADAEALRESEERFRQFAEASPDVLWIRSADTLAWEFLSPGFEKVYGMTVEEALSGDTLKCWLELIVPADRDRALENIRKVAAGKRATFEYRIARPDGTIRWVRDTDFPIRDAAGKVVAVGGVGHDATEEKQVAARQAVLLAELHHRTSNLLGAIRSIARRTAETSTDLEDFLTHFDGRLAAVGRTQVAMTRSTEVAANLDSIILEEFLAAAGSEQVTLKGPDVVLGGKAAEAFSLAIHELVTNALKYGALASTKGHVHIRWTVKPTGDGPRLTLEWQETGVGVMDPHPARSGFGRRLLEKALPAELGARTQLEFKPGGLHAVIEAPLKPPEATP